MDAVYLALLSIGLLFLGQWSGTFVRHRAHVLVPLNDPVSMFLILVPTFGPFVYEILNPSFVALDLPVEYWVGLVAFLCGYLYSYTREQADIVYVGVHDILNRTQEIYPIVRYYSPDGRQCWQPQTFRGVFRSMFLGIHNPLDLRAMSNPRHVSIRKVFLSLDAEAYDMAAYETTESEVRKFHYTFRIQARKYTPSPHCTDAPYDWIQNAQGYEQLFLEYSKAQTDAIDRQVNLDVAALKGARMIMEAAGAKTPSREYMEELGIDLTTELNRSARRIERERRKRRAEPEVDDDYPE